MNIDQYRELKAQESQASQTTEQTPVTATSTETTPATTPVVETTAPSVETTPIETTPEVTPTATLPDKITIDGIGEVSVEELKNGYLRQSDYTRKTQEVSRKTKEVEEAVVLFEHLKQNPQLAQQLLQTKELPANLDPTQTKVSELEEKLYDMMLEKEIDTLSSKYSDFEVKDVLEIAQKKGITNLEDAYLLSKSYKSTHQTTDIEKFKEQMKKEVMAELEQERKSTQSIISSRGDSPIVQTNAPKLSDAEHKVAKMMKLSDDDYIKWRDVSRN